MKIYFAKTKLICYVSFSGREKLSSIASALATCQSQGTLNWSTIVSPQLKLNSIWAVANKVASKTPDHFAQLSKVLNEKKKYKKRYHVFSGAWSKSWNQQNYHSLANFCLRALVFLIFKLLKSANFCLRALVFLIF